MFWNIKNKSGIFYYLSIFSQIGFTMVLSIIMCLFLYKILEKIIGKNVLLMFIFIIIGVFQGFYLVYKLIMKKM